MNPIKSLLRGLIDGTIKQRAAGSYAAYALARRIVAAYENHDVDMATNGEHWLVQQLASRMPITAIDVGANKGEWSKAVLANAPDARLLSCEPVPATFAALQAAIHGPNVKLINLALSSQPGTMTIHTVPDNPYIASVYNGNLYSAELGKVAIDLRATTGDELVREHTLEHIDILKIDAEGHDFEVLIGFQSSIERGIVDLIQFEYNIFTLEAGRSLYDFFEFLSPHYLVCRLLPQGLEVCGYHSTLDNFGQSNWVALRKNILDPDLAERLKLRRARGLPGLALEKALENGMRLGVCL